MIGYISGKFIGFDDSNILIDVSGVGYSLTVPEDFARRLNPQQSVTVFVYTNLRENALELFGFETEWEKRVFLLLTSVSGVGPRTAIGMLSGIRADTLLAAIVRQDRATLTSAPGVGKKTAERLLLELAEKAGKLLSDRPKIAGAQSIASAPTAAAGVTDNASSRPAKRPSAEVPQQGASAVDVADLWNDALIALQNLGYRDGDAIAAIRQAASGLPENYKLDRLIMSSLQLLSRGL